MKRKILFCLSAIFCLAGTASAQAAGSPAVYLDGEPMAFDVAPIVQNDRTMVPYRAIFEELGYTVSWNAQEQSVSATKDGASMWMQIGNKNVTVNGKNVVSDAAPFLQSDRTLVPLRLVSEYSGCDVLWDGATETVAMYHKQAKNAHSSKNGCVTTDGMTLLVDKINEAENIWGTQGYSLTDLSPVGRIDLGPVDFVWDGVGYGIRTRSPDSPYDPTLFAVHMETGEVLHTAEPPVYRGRLMLDAAQGQIYFIDFDHFDTVFRLDPQTLEWDKSLSVELGNINTLYIYDNQIFCNVYANGADDKKGYITQITNLLDGTMETIPPLHEGEYPGEILQKGDFIYQKCFYAIAEDNTGSFIKVYNIKTKELHEISVPNPISSFDVTENSIFYMNSENDGTLYRMSLQGKTPMVLADHLFMPGWNSATGPLDGADLTIIGNTAYFTRWDFAPDYGGYDLSSAVVAVPTCGGTPYVLDYWIAMQHRMS